MTANISKTDLLTTLTSWAKKAFSIIPVLVAAASAVTAVIPDASDEHEILVVIQKVLDVVALNVGNNSHEILNSTSVSTSGNDV